MSVLIYLFITSVVIPYLSIFLWCNTQPGSFNDLFCFMHYFPWITVSSSTSEIRILNDFWSLWFLLCQIQSFLCHVQFLRFAFTFTLQRLFCCPLCYFYQCNIPPNSSFWPCSLQLLCFIGLFLFTFWVTYMMFGSISQPKIKSFFFFVLSLF